LLGEAVVKRGEEVTPFMGEMEKNNHPILLAFLSVFSRVATVT